MHNVISQTAVYSSKYELNETDPELANKLRMKIKQTDLFGYC